MITSKRLLAVIGIIVIVFSLSACSRKTNLNSEISGIQQTPSTNANSEQIYSQEANKPFEYIDNEELKRLKEVIITSINDHIWYNGEYSPFIGFLSQESEIELYTRSAAPSILSVYFKKGFKGGKYEKGNEYFYVVDFWKGPKGYDNNIAGYFVEDVPDKIENRLKNEGYQFNKISNIKFNDLIEPKFPEMQEKEKAIVQEIKKALPSAINSWGLKPNTYKVYIKKFRNTDYTTILIIENHNGEQWLGEVDLSKTGNAYIGRLNKVEFEDQKYSAAQYKKVSLEGYYD
ncbi:MAG: hypothetical protein CVU89_04520 [Firmicutes bacterium HGW-Firmicutes-14]|nr:MAG: hypothetical protein CVU89_04520 [Firmicutes bacterium HGW-Firmicutes-14]